MRNYASRNKALMDRLLPEVRCLNGLCDDCVAARCDIGAVKMACARLCRQEQGGHGHAAARGGPFKFCAHSLSLHMRLQWRRSRDCFDPCKALS